ncbi:MAG: DUF1570 domain-containing protein [Phycisphaerae bacterium]|nr:DUF1570 domain-containing protein [Phycisphaerae bacterium]
MSKFSIYIACSLILLAAVPGRTAEHAAYAQFVHTLGQKFSFIETDHFFIVFDSDENWAKQTGTILEDLHNGFYNTFEKAGYSLTPLSGRLMWVCFTDYKDFDNYASDADWMDNSWLDAYYSSRTNRVAMVLPQNLKNRNSRLVAMNFDTKLHPSVTDSPKSGSPDLTRTVHEAAHQLAFNSGLQKRGVMYPFWVSEGLATNFEYTSIEGENENPLSGNSVRQKRLLNSQNRNRLLPLFDFVASTSIPTGKGTAAKDAYAQAWGFWRFLFKTHPQQLKQYLEILADSNPGKRDSIAMCRDFETVFGPAKDLEAQWRNFISTLEK